MYQDQFLVDLIQLDEVSVATSLRFGKVGREEGTYITILGTVFRPFRPGNSSGALVIVTRRGGLIVKLFKRTAKLTDKAEVRI